jgi:two-component system sensor histidine kinase BarA
MNTVVTMKYLDKIKSGSVIDQMKVLSQLNNYHYKKEFQKLNNALSTIRQYDASLNQYNNQLIEVLQVSLPEFNQLTSDVKKDTQLKILKQTNLNKAIRNYTMVAIIMIMIIASILLFSLTQISFEFEKQLKEAQEKINHNLNYKNRIIGMISHEIRSPLSLISIYSKMISNDIEDKEIKENFNSIQFTTNSLLMLSNQILEYSKDEKKKLTLNNSKFNLASELNQILNSMKALVEVNGNQLIINSTIKPTVQVDTDVTKIHQLFYNLIGNANKYTSNGIINVTLSQEVLNDYEIKFQARISDNGKGISKEDLQHIFEPYYQGTTQSNLALGIGLGLNLCKEIIDLFDGEIKVESEKEKGTTILFTIDLPKS